MSNIEDNLGGRLARRIQEGRKHHDWSLADLAARSGVSKAMLSKIERVETSPTASVLVRIATALSMTLAELLTELQPEEPRHMAAGDQPTWVDAGAGYLRRQVYLSTRLPLELVEIHLPPGAAVAIPASAYLNIKQVVWVLEGALTVAEGSLVTRLGPGDRLEFGPPSDCVLRNDEGHECRYLVALVRD